MVMSRDSYSTWSVCVYIPTWWLMSGTMYGHYLELYSGGLSSNRVSTNN